MKSVQAGVRRVQAPLARREYEAFRRAARREHLSLQDALREAALAWASKRGETTESLEGLIGKLSGPSDASRDIDSDYEED